jgi:hypothetical protein
MISVSQALPHLSFPAPDRKHFCHQYPILTNTPVTNTPSLDRKHFCHQYPCHQYPILAGAGLHSSNRKIQSAAETFPGGILLGKHHHDCSASSIAARRKRYESHMAWDAVQRIEETAEHILIYVDSVHALLLPKRDLESPGSVLSVLNYHSSTATDEAKQIT